MNQKWLRYSICLKKTEFIRKLDKAIKTMKNNLYGIQIMLDKGYFNVLTVQSTLDMCKTMDKSYDTEMYSYYSKDLNGVSDYDTQRLIDVWKQAIHELEVKRRAII